ncbi:hypothetical protein [Afipia carboxidovorans]|uniref:hypothetical protein n=1 Tax=Afipia carboxidovorans TaxID=40137 RepID=UPI00308613F7|nr:hypothetical protein CRBSH125_09520 [Afipia carboxidovorans]
MSREAILAEIRQIEAQKRSNPQFARSFDEQITALCDKLKGLRDFEPRKVV